MTIEKKENCEELTTKELIKTTLAEIEILIDKFTENPTIENKKNLKNYMFWFVKTFSDFTEEVKKTLKRIEKVGNF